MSYLDKRFSLFFSQQERCVKLQRKASRLRPRLFYDGADASATRLVLRIRRHLLRLSRRRRHARARAQKRLTREKSKPRIESAASNKLDRLTHNNPTNLVLMINYPGFNRIIP